MLLLLFCLWIMFTDPRWKLLGFFFVVCVSPSRWSPLDHRSGRNVSPPTTPDCLQLMTHSHHLMLPSRHVGKTYTV